MELKTGDIVFCINKKSWISKILAWFMQSQWSHTFIILEKTSKRTYEIETTDFEVAISCFENKYLKDNYAFEVWRPTELASLTLDKVADVCLTEEGSIYGYLQFISLGIRCLLKRVNIKISNFIKVGIICCSVVLKGYSKTPNTPFTGIPYESMDTEDFYKLVKNGPFKMTYEQK